MHPNRRRKKRPNYGIRTVEVARGPNGFGFTISGQQPCILSCIVTNSPADQAGLRAGDFLISVNGLSVSKITHDAVVNLIGNCVGPIKMSIAENYYSDSSDDELDVSRLVSNRKPKYSHKPRPHRNFKHENVSTENMCIDVPMKKIVKCREGASARVDNAHGISIPEDLPQNLNDVGPMVYRALVGYVGTIEMPNRLMPSSYLQTVCSCIRKLRQEKRTPSAVLMTVLPTCITLKNANKHVLATYPVNRVVYIGSSTDKDSRYFGLVTSAINDNKNQQMFEMHYQNIWQLESADAKKNMYVTEKNNYEMDISNSCHVFSTDPKLVDHNVHLSKADLFKMICTPDQITGSCLEFPKNALYIVSLVQNMYRLQDVSNVSQREQKNPAQMRLHQDENLVPLLANSPQPSASSNSDSGIGFRDDCGNISDRILVVEFPSDRVLPAMNRPSPNARPVAISGSNVNLEMFDMKTYNKCDINDVNASDSCKSKRFRENVLNNIRACGSKNNIEKENCNNFPMKSPNAADILNIRSHRCEKDWANRLTVRAKPNPVLTAAAAAAAAAADESVRTGCVDTGLVFTERPVDVVVVPLEKVHNKQVLSEVQENKEVLNNSVDDVSVRSFDLSSTAATNQSSHVFKTPSCKFFETKKCKRTRQLSSCENLDSAKTQNSLMNYKLSPKVYGVSKPNYSCEELNTLDSVEKCNFGSLQELCSWKIPNGTKRHGAVSEPDVRIHDNAKDRLQLMCEDNESTASTNPNGPACWAGTFEKLLDDPLGLHTFAEFLKKEFSAENIYFWTACERYRRIPTTTDRITEAQKIYKQHLCVGAPEPVNVDSQGRQFTPQSLQEADKTLFEAAQKQIFNLMKFDSYPRFLKSDLYKQCLNNNGNIIEKTQLDVGLMLQPSSGTPSKLKKSLSNAEDRRRKSLLPWHRKNRSKSKDRGESEYNLKRDDSSARSIDGGDGQIGKMGSDVHSSRSSLTSLDLAMSCNAQDGMSNKGSCDELIVNHVSATTPSANQKTSLCRVILSDGATTVVQIRTSETIRQLVNRLLDKRGLTYSAYEVYLEKCAKALDLSEHSTVLSGCEVTIEQRVVFKLDLPNRKVICVKSKATKLLIDVLKPILHKYSYNIDIVLVNFVKANGEVENVDYSLPVTSVDGMRLLVQLCDYMKDGHQAQSVIKNLHRVTAPSLDEITNRVFEELLQEKADFCREKPKSDRGGSVKSEDWGSEHSSGIFNRFLRRDSGMHEKKKKLLITRSKGNSTHSSVEDMSGANGENNVKKPLIAKWKAGVRLQVACSESDELYEGLKRAQRSRLEDQRGTEINFELPDFLKDKENNKTWKLHKSTCGSSADATTLVVKEKERRIPPVAAMRHLKPSSSKTLLTTEITNKTVLQSVDLDKNVPLVSDCSEADEVKTNNMKSSDPPPLPPKPKVLPTKPSNWGQNGTSMKQISRDILTKGDAMKQTLYLEQAASSFV